MTLSKLYREKVEERRRGRSDPSLSSSTSSGGADTTSPAGGGTFITQNPNEAGVRLAAGSYETSKLTVLEQKHRELRETQDALAQKKLEYERRVAAVKEKEAELKQRQAEFSDRVERNSERIHEADAKLCRATRRIESELRKQSALSEQLKEDSRDLSKVETECQAEKAELDAHRCYESFLSDVVEKFDLFSTIAEVLRRYETLKTTQAELHSGQRAREREMDACARATQALLLEAENETLARNSEYLALGETLDDLQRSNHKLETEFTMISQGREGTSKLSAEIQMSIQNLFESAQASHTTPNPRPLTTASWASAPPPPAGMVQSASSHHLLGLSHQRPRQVTHISPRRLLALLNRVHARILELESISTDFRRTELAAQFRRAPPVRALSVSSSVSTSEASSLISGEGEHGGINGN